MNNQSKPAPTVLRRKQVEQRVGLSRSSIYNMVHAGTFPMPISLGKNSVGWIESDITDWLNVRIAQRAQPALGPSSSTVA